MLILSSTSAAVPLGAGKESQAPRLPVEGIQSAVPAIRQVLQHLRILGTESRSATAGLCTIDGHLGTEGPSLASGRP